jgi:hypothetical protein
VLERNFKNRNYSAFDYKFSKLINKTDVVFCEHPAYYSIKSRCNRVYTIQTLDLMNERELALVNKLVINPRRSKLRLSKKFDFAQWEMKSQSYCDLESGGFPNEDYNLVVYTRKIVL